VSPRLRPTGLGLLLLLVAGTAGCAGTDLAARVGKVRDALATARSKGAYWCAPRELARGEANVEFADREFGKGEFFAAKDHLETAQAAAEAALRLSTDERSCPKTKPAPPRRPEPKPDPLADRDGDGVPDVKDHCPDEPEDRDGFEDEDGCPDPDNDKDGILDTKDKCPNEPGPESEGGCPKFEHIKVTEEKIELKQAIFFQTAKSVIMPKSFGLLDEVVAVLSARPNMRVRIEGHTDSRGTRPYNLRLSQARAESVKAYLVGKGISSDRMEAKGYGPDQPIDNNRTAAGRERNRRVEFMITQQ
jgi:outer membrane protein OmpA-like peptidoglycan-associated protein